MGYQRGTLGPYRIEQSNTGVDTDMDITRTYRPDHLGAPPGARIDIASTKPPAVTVKQGKAYIHDYQLTDDQMIFTVYTQAANNGLFGWHSGDIVVETSIDWYVSPE